MATGLQANTGAMNQNGRDTVANADYFQNEITSLKTNEEGLMGIWKGLSANEFDKSYQGQEKNLMDFQILLNDLGESISQGANILNRTEEDNASAGAHLFS